MYSQINFWKFLVGLGIVSIPLLVTDDAEWKMYYVIILLLGFALVNATGLNGFLTFVQKQTANPSGPVLS
jgi:hypothetical protein